MDGIILPGDYNTMKSGSFIIENNIYVAEYSALVGGYIGCNFVRKQL